MKKETIRLLLKTFVSCVLLVVTLFLVSFANNKIHVNYVPYDEFDDKNAEVISPVEIKYLPMINGRQFTCTGMAYDSSDNSFWLCNFGKDSEEDKQTASIVQMDSSFSNVLNDFPLKSETHLNLQGITIDSVNKTVWYTTGDYLIEMNRSGEEIKRFKTQYVYNGLLFDQITDSFYVLCQKQHLIRVSRTNEIIEKYDINYRDQDHICFNNEGEILITAGADYKGDKNYIVSFNIKTKQKVTKYKIKSSYAAEGIATIDKKIFVCNDGYYHNSTIKSNYIAVYIV